MPNKVLRPACCAKVAAPLLPVIPSMPSCVAPRYTSAGGMPQSKASRQSSCEHLVLASHSASAAGDSRAARRLRGLAPLLRILPPARGGGAPPGGRLQRRLVGARTGAMCNLCIRWLGRVDGEGRNQAGLTPWGKGMLWRAGPHTDPHSWAAAGWSGGRHPVAPPTHTLNRSACALLQAQPASFAATAATKEQGEPQDQFIESSVMLMQVRGRRLCVWASGCGCWDLACRPALSLLPGMRHRPACCRPALVCNGFCKPDNWTAAELGTHSCHFCVLFSASSAPP